MKNAQNPMWSSIYTKKSRRDDRHFKLCINQTNKIVSYLKKEKHCARPNHCSPIFCRYFYIGN